MGWLGIVLAAIAAAVAGAFIFILPYLFPDIIPNAIGAFLKWRRHRKRCGRARTSIPAGKLRPREITDRRVRDALEALVGRWHDGYRRFPDRDGRVIEAIREHGRVLILGRAKVGKTRLAIEAVRWLVREDPDYRNAVLVIVHKDPANNECPVRRRWGLRKYSCVFLLFDNLDEYVGVVDIVGLVRRFRKVARRVVVLATCRTSEVGKVLASEPLLDLFPQHVRVEVEEFSEEEGREIARALSKEFRPEVFDGTAGSIVYEEARGLVVEYHKLGEAGRSVLKAIKLLHFGGVRRPRKRSVEKVWRAVFNIGADFSSCYADLERKGFFRTVEEDGLEVVDVRLPALQVISDYRPTYDDLEKALDALYADKGAWEELFHMGIAFLRGKGREEEAIRCFTHVIENGPAEWRAVAYYNRAVAYGRLGKRLEAYEDLDKAMKLDPVLTSDLYGLPRLLEGFEERWESLAGEPGERAELALAVLDRLLLLRHWGARVPEGELDKWLDRARGLREVLGPEGKKRLASIEEALRRR